MRLHIAHVGNDDNDDAARTHRRRTKEIGNRQNGAGLKRGYVRGTTENPFTRYMVCGEATHENSKLISFPYMRVESIQSYMALLVTKTSSSKRAQRKRNTYYTVYQNNIRFVEPLCWFFWGMSAIMRRIKVYVKSPARERNQSKS